MESAFMRDMLGQQKQNVIESNTTGPLNSQHLPPSTMQHLILLGDSIFDNASYTARGSAVIDHLGRQLPPGWNASLLAVDGATSTQVPKQLGKMPASATHLALSAGGNDALGCMAALNTPCTSVFQGMRAMTEIRSNFQTNYRALIDAVLQLDKPLLLCTIYDKVPGLSAELLSALTFFNDVILREAILHGLPVIDLRFVCSDAEDYSTVSPIEPSSQGGAKLAQRLVATVIQHDFLHGGCRIYG